MNVPEYLSDGAWDVARRLLATLFRLLIDTGGQSIAIRFGTKTITWTGGGSPRAGNASVTHGLGRTPVVAFATATSGVGASTTVFPVVAVRGTTLTDTTLEVTAVTSDESSPVNGTVCTCFWLAIG